MWCRKANSQLASRVLRVKCRNLGNMEKEAPRKASCGEENVFGSDICFDGNKLLFIWWNKKNPKPFTGECSSCRGEVWREGHTRCSIGGPGRKLGLWQLCHLPHSAVHHSRGDDVHSILHHLLLKGSLFGECCLSGCFLGVCLSNGTRVLTSDAARTVSEGPDSANHCVKLCPRTLEGLETWR